MSYIYLDHGASTPVHPDVVTAMRPHWTEIYGNSSSVHSAGRKARQALETSRRTFAQLLNAHIGEIVFTGCGSEANNLALRGALWAAQKEGRGNHLVISAIEHSSVHNTACQLRDYFGVDLTLVPVDKYGMVRPEDVKTAVNERTTLISIMAANNEVGTLQPIHEIGAFARQHGILFHTDAIQSAAIMRWDMAAMPIDLMSISPHKFYGPKGVGILYVRKGINLIPTLSGGSHEEGRRAGTVNVPYVVGAAKAFELAMAELDETLAHYQPLRDRLIAGVLELFPDECVLTGHPTLRLPHNASFAFHQLEGNDMLMHLDLAGIAASSGSACLTGNPEPSRILEAIGFGPAWTKGGLRLTVGKQNTPAEIDTLLDKLPSVVEKLKRFASFTL